MLWADAWCDCGYYYDDVVEQLEVEGVSKFEDSWSELTTSVTDQLAKAKKA